MKYDPGSTHIGVPKAILSNPPAGVALIRGKNKHVLQPHGEITSPVYLKNYIRVGGLLTQVSFIQTRVWLLGYPVLTRFVNTINVTANEPVKFEPLPGETGLKIDVDTFEPY